MPVLEASRTARKRIVLLAFFVFVGIFVNNFPRGASERVHVRLRESICLASREYSFWAKTVLLWPRKSTLSELGRAKNRKKRPFIT